MGDKVKQDRKSLIYSWGRGGEGEGRVGVVFCVSLGYASSEPHQDINVDIDEPTCSTSCQEMGDKVKQDRDSLLIYPGGRRGEGEGGGGVGVVFCVS